MTRRALLAAAGGSVLAAGHAAARQATPAASRPNIALILTDDLDFRSVELMPNVQALLAHQGTTFSRFFVSTPLCAPSRASILRGQYAHNHSVYSNTGDNGGFPAFDRLGDEGSTVATWLQAAGYRTALFGKYLNRYPRTAVDIYIPAGWDEWYGLTDRGLNFYLDFQLNENGTLVDYGTNPDDYLTDVLSAKATDFIARTASSGQPFFAYVAPYAPHSPSTPAPRHAEAFADAQAPRVPSFNEADVSDKPAWVQAQPLLTPDQINRVDEHYRDRLRSLLAVDEMVTAIVAALAAAGQLDNTFLLFSSDNGFHIGEHRLPLGKLTPYEEAIRVPLIVRGPGVPNLAVVDRLTLNVDLAPTFAEWAGAAAPDSVDGRSLAPLLREPAPPAWRGSILIEHFPVARQSRPAAPARAGASPSAESDEGDNGGISPADAPPYRAVRTDRYAYVEYDDGERELYDLEADPYELQNLAATADPALVSALHAALAGLLDCKAGGCRAAEDRPLPTAAG